MAGWETEWPLQPGTNHQRLPRWPLPTVPPYHDARVCQHQFNCALLAAEVQPIQPYQPPKSSNPTVASAQDIAAAVAAGNIDGAAQMIAKAPAGGEGRLGRAKGCMDLTALEL